MESKDKLEDSKQQSQNCQKLEEVSLARTESDQVKAQDIEQENKLESLMKNLSEEQNDMLMMIIETVEDEINTESQEQGLSFNDLPPFDHKDPDKQQLLELLIHGAKNGLKECLQLKFSSYLPDEIFLLNYQEEEAKTKGQIDIPQHILHYKGVKEFLFGQDQVRDEPQSSLFIDKMKWQDYSKRIQEWYDKENYKSQPFFLEFFRHIEQRIRTQETMTSLCQHKIFTIDGSPVYDINERTLMALFLEYTGKQAPYIMEQYLKIPRLALPFLFPRLNGTEIKETFLLNYYQRILNIDHPYIISFGEPLVGKSYLLNQIFSTEFPLSRKNIFHNTIDITFSTENFTLGAHILDVQGDINDNIELLAKLSKALGEGVWLIIHGKSSQYFQEMLEKLQKLEKTGIEIKNDQIIIIRRDSDIFADDWKEKGKFIQISNRFKKNFFEIMKSQEGNVYQSKTNELREKIVGRISESGVIQKALNIHKKPQNVPMFSIIQERFQNGLSEYDIIRVSKEFTDLQSYIDDSLSKIQEKNKDKTELDYLHNELFIFTRLRREMEAVLAKDKLTYDQKIEHIERIKKQLNEQVSGPLAQKFEYCLNYPDLSLLNKFEESLIQWQVPILEPLIKKYHGFEKQKKKLLEVISEQDKENQEEIKLTEREKTLKEIKEVYKQQDEIGLQIDKLRTNREHFWRETFCKFQYYKQQKLNNKEVDLFMNNFVKFLNSGGEIEIIDGENNEIHADILKEMFNKHQNNLKQRHENLDQEINDNLFVISIIGPQSTGKSTLLNFLFGTNFQMSAGRCTRGLYASLFETNYPKAKKCLVLDSEGILSMEKKDEKFDKKLTIFAMAMSQILIINVMGEINESMKKVLQISVFCAQNIVASLKVKPTIFFVLRNMQDDNMDKQLEMVTHIGKSFEEVGNAANIELKDIVDYRESESFSLFLSAFNKDKLSTLNNTVVSVVNSSFREKCDLFRDKIFKEALRESNINTNRNLEDWIDKANLVWKSVNDFDDLLKVNDLAEIECRKSLQEYSSFLINLYIERKHGSQQEGESVVMSLKDQLDKLINKRFTEYREKKIEIQKLNQVIQEIEQTKHETIAQIEGQFNASEKVQEISKKVTESVIQEYLRNINDSSYRVASEVTAIFNFKLEQIKTENDFELAMKALDEWIYLELCKHKKDGSIEQKQRNMIHEEFDKQFDLLLEELKKKVIKPTGKLKEEAQDKFKKFLLYYKQQNIVSQKQVINIKYLGDGIMHKESIIPIQNPVTIFMEGMEAESKDQIQEAIKRFIVMLSNTQVYENQILTQGSNVGIYERNERQGHQKQDKKKKKQNQGTKSFKKQFIDSIKSFFVSDKDNENQQQLSETARYVKNKKKEREEVKIGKAKEILSTLYQIYQDEQLDKVGVINSEYIYNLCSLINQFNFKVEQDLSENGFQFSDTSFYECITQDLYSKCTERMVKLQQKQENDIIEEFKALRSPKIKELDTKISSFKGDLEKAKLVSLLLFKKLCSHTYKKETDMFISSYSDQIKCSKQEMEEEITKILGSSKATEIYNCIKNPIETMKSKFASYFDNQIIELFKKLNNDIKSKVNKESIEIINAIKELENSMKPLSEVHNKANDQQKEQIYQLFIYFLKNRNEAIEKKNKLKDHIPDFENLELSKTEPKYDPQFLNDINELKEGSIKGVIHQFLNNVQITLNDLREEEVKSSKSQHIKEINKNNYQALIDDTSIMKENTAIGCRELCPYCGVQCSLDFKHNGKHSAKNHRPMSFKGCWYIDKQGLQRFLFDICDSQTNQQSIWKYVGHQKVEENTGYPIDADLRQRLEQESATIGDLNFALKWSDPNDLDLHVICPCGTEIYYGHRKCKECNGELDVDMNNQKMDKDNPCEHIYFNNAKVGIYKFWVRYY